MDRIQTRRSAIRALWLGALAACLLVAPAGARTLGAGGMLGDVDLARGTVEVGRYTLRVTPRSVLRDAYGNRISLRDLSRMNGDAGVRLLEARGGYVLQELQMVGIQEDDPEIDSPPPAKPAGTKSPRVGRWSKRR